MSSFAAHAAAAYVVAAVALPPGGRSRLAWVALPVLGFAWLPDGDYALRLAGLADPQHRWSHSVGFVAMVWIVFAGVARSGPGLVRGWGTGRVLFACLIAGLSHVLMDWLVGSAWGDPVLWPVSDALHAAPVGVLPASGGLNPANPYLWRNLAIEAGLFGPMVWAASRWRRGTLTRGRAGAALAAMAPFAVWGMSLAR